jgi:hypothetical protein
LFQNILIQSSGWGFYNQAVQPLFTRPFENYTGWVVGHDGEILNTTNGGPVISTKQYFESQPFR